MVTHLTLTGPYAGTLLCNTNKETAKANDDQFLHYQYYDRIAENPLNYQPVCEECKAFMADEKNWD